MWLSLRAGRVELFLTRVSPSGQARAGESSWLAATSEPFHPPPHFPASEISHALKYDHGTRFRLAHRQPLSQVRIRDSPAPAAKMARLAVLLLSLLAAAARAGAQEPVLATTSSCAARPPAELLVCVNSYVDQRKTAAGGVSCSSLGPELAQACVAVWCESRQGLHAW